jgi:hypothetical protein
MGDSTWVKRTSLWKGLSWQAGRVGEKDAQGWAGDIEGLMFNTCGIQWPYKD